MNDIHPNIQKAKDAIARKDHNDAIILCKTAIKPIEKVKDRHSIKAKIEFYFILAEISELEGRWIDSLMYLERVLELERMSKDHISRAKAFIQMGDVFFKSGKLDNSIDRFKMAENIVKNFNNPQLLGETITGKGYV